MGRSAGRHRRLRAAGRARDPADPRVHPGGPVSRDAYRHFLPIPTRWKDNDVYGHVNNVEYYSYFDTVINTWLIREGGLDIHRGDTIGLCAESHCRFASEIAFPETVEAGLRVEHLGNSSVRYGIGLFREGREAPAAEGWFVHVFVDRETRRSQPIPQRIRDCLERIRIEATDEGSST
nr:thioesterase family protein [Lysobacter penaei]